ncbi:MAG TPA: hypothetical protein VI542_24255 [Candidatus Tectomicrobia bacterium]
MLRNISKTVGSAMAALCLVSTLVMAQSQSPSQPVPPGGNPSIQQVQPATPTQPQPIPQHLTCTKDDGKGNCIAAAAADGKEIVVVGAGVKKGEAMSCMAMGSVLSCRTPRG